MSRKLIPLCLAFMLTLTGCGSYYTMNGVPLRGQEEQTGVSTGNLPDFKNMSLESLKKYCDTNPAVCVTAGIGVIGLTGFIVSEIQDDDTCTDPCRCNRAARC